MPKTKVPFIVLAVSAGLGVLPAHGAGPSFDCRKASLPDERAICADPQLAAIDVLIAKAFKDFEPSFGGSKRLIGRQLVKDRNACAGDTACIASDMTNALGTFGSIPAWAESYAEGLVGQKAMQFAARTSHTSNQPIPGTVGQCTMTHIAKLTPRLTSEGSDDPLQGAPAGSGVAVTFTDEGVQTSYDDVQSVIGASVGDPVVRCLMSTPRDCPKDDERGKIYYSLDLRTGGTWVLPDAEHLCGGA